MFQLIRGPNLLQSLISKLVSCPRVLPRPWDFRNSPCHESVYDLHSKRKSLGVSEGSWPLLSYQARMRAILRPSYDCTSVIHRREIYRLRQDNCDDFMFIRATLILLLQIMKIKRKKWKFVWSFHKCFDWNVHINMYLPIIYMLYETWKDRKRLYLWYLQFPSVMLRRDSCQIFIDMTLYEVDVFLFIYLSFLHIYSQYNII